MLLFLYIFLLLTSPVSADGFDVIYNRGNSSFSRYRQTTGISYSYLPTLKNSFEPGLSYDISLIEGVETEKARSQSQGKYQHRQKREPLGEQINRCQ